MRHILRHVLSAIALVAPHVSVQAEPAGSPVKLGSYALDITEVTVGRFRTFVEASNYITKAERDGGGNEFAAGWVQRLGWTWSAAYGVPSARDEPVVHVTHAEAHDFCIAQGGRLPTLAEWRRAAFTEFRSSPLGPFRMGNTYLYPVGDTPDGMNVNGNKHTLAGTTAVGVNGLYEMGGNVWEWLADERGDAALTVGGSWWYGPEKTMDGQSQWKPKEFAAVYIGFRCAYDL